MSHGRTLVELRQEMISMMMMMMMSFFLSHHNNVQKILLPPTTSSRHILSLLNPIQQPHSLSLHVMWKITQMLA